MTRATRYNLIPIQHLASSDKKLNSLCHTSTQTSAGIIYLALIIIINKVQIPDTQLTSRKEVVSRIKNMLIIPRYLVIFAPGMKERGVILTTEMVELAHDGKERCRKYPSANGLALSSEAAKKMKKKEEKVTIKKDQSLFLNTQQLFFMVSK